MINDKTMITYFKKIFNIIKQLICPIKYHITIDNGLFNISVNELDITNDEEVIVERISKLPKNVINAHIRVFTDKKQQISVITIKKGLKWKFIMPKSNVIIVPIAKRKFKDF